MTVDTLEVDTDTVPGAILDRVIRKANLLNLVDYYLGAQVDYDSNRVSVFFAEEADPEVLEELKEESEIENFNATLVKTTEDGAAYVLTLEMAAIPREVSAVASGDVPVDVSLTGTVDVLDQPEVGAER